MLASNQVGIVVILPLPCLTCCSLSQVVRETIQHLCASLLVLLSLLQPRASVEIVIAARIVISLFPGNL